MIRKLLIYLLLAGGGILSLTCSVFAQKPYEKEVLALRYSFVNSIPSSIEHNLSSTRFLVQSPTVEQSDYQTDNSFFLPLIRFSPKPAGSYFEAKFSLSQKSYLSMNHGFANGKRKLTALVPGQNRINYRRASLIGIVNSSIVFFGFKYALSSWGKSNGRFHIKDDWKGDHLAQTDELSHFLWGYKMTQFQFASYRWAGLSSQTSHLLSIFEVAFVLTLVEYPIDAYNPKQGLGVSDLVFDYLGIGTAFAKNQQAWLDDFDFKISWKRNLFTSTHPVFAETYQEYDNFIYWLTYRTKLFLPRKIFCFGLGYGVTHQGSEPKRQYYCGIGLSLSDFASLFWNKLRTPAKFLDMFYPNLSIEL